MYLLYASIILVLIHKKWLKYILNDLVHVISHAICVGILDDEVPQVLINREPLKHLTFDVELLGDCDVIIGELCRRLGSDWLHGIGLSPTHKSAGNFYNIVV